MSRRSVIVLFAFLGCLLQRGLADTAAQTAGHWAFQPLNRPPVPTTEEPSRAANPIDRFISARLEREGITPSGPADRRTLIRRLYFDLVGLPPSNDEAESFIHESEPDAYDRLISRLLDSPEYGEHWARHWLDIVHYADTHGNDHDYARFNAWPYRDYVIRAFNSDKPYSQFVREQVAGDALFPGSPDATVALGFLAAGPWDDTLMVTVREDTVDHRLSQVLDRDNMVTTVMSTFQSVTVQCARCHNHKFDPIRQQEYYNLQAVFAGVDRADRPFDADPAIHARRQALLNRKHGIAARDRTVLASLTDAQTEVARLTEEVAQWANAWTPLQIISVTSASATSGVSFTRESDGSWFAGGDRPDRETYIITAQTALEHITALRLQVLPDDRLPQRGPGRYENGNFHLSEIRASVQPSQSLSGRVEPVQFSSATVDHSGDGQGGPGLIDGKSETYWSVHPRYGEPHDAVLECKNTVQNAGGSTFVIRLEHEEMKGHQIGRFRLFVSSELEAKRRRPVLPDAIQAALKVPEADRSAEQKTELALYALNAQIERELAALPKPKFVYAATRDFTSTGSFKPSLKPRLIQVLKRGDINRPEQQAEPGALSCLPGLPGKLDICDLEEEALRREALAEWLTDERNVLTWRSIVNRVWQFHFGRGLVETPNDFGEMGRPPSHPELLDWLAVWFRDDAKGSLKALHRLVLTSQAWQRSSFGRQGAAVDADNHLLWRQNRTRLTAEQLRDTMLALSGQLDRTMGGPAAIQFIHKDKATFNTDGAPPFLDYENFDADSAAASRRAVYRFLFRTVPDPLMDTLDCPDGSALTPLRPVSTTALQALALLNDHFLIRQCEKLATRITNGHPDPAERVRTLYRKMLQREPNMEELSTVTSYSVRHGLANCAHLLMNSNEFMFLD